MNWKSLTHRLSLLIVSLALFSFAGCASIGSSGTKKLLDEAGFRTVAPSTPKQQELYAAIPAYQVERVTYNGKTFYAYKDKRDGIAYVGDEHNFQEYEKLAAQQHIEQQQAVEMNHDLAMGWYGAYGPYVGRLHHYGRYR
jgi:hypothetical protein